MTEHKKNGGEQSEGTTLGNNAIWKLFWDARKGRLTQAERKAYEEALKNKPRLRDDLDELNAMLLVHKQKKLSEEEENEIVQGVDKRIREIIENGNKSDA